VELVATPARPASDPDGRSAFDLTRRDFVMLGIGAGGVLTAIAAGYGLAKLFKHAGGPPEPKEKAKEEQSKEE